MQSRFIITALAALSLSTAALADPGHSHGDARAYGEPGDPKKPGRTIQITMREADGKMLFVPDRLDIRKGEQIKFAVRNSGELDHEIVVVRQRRDNEGKTEDRRQQNGKRLFQFAHPFIDRSIPI